LCVADYNPANRREVKDQDIHINMYLNNEYHRVNTGDQDYHSHDVKEEEWKHPPPRLPDQELDHIVHRQAKHCKQHQTTQIGQRDDRRLSLPTHFLINNIIRQAGQPFNHRQLLLQKY